MALSFLQDTLNTGLRRHHGSSMKDTVSSDHGDSRGQLCDSPTSLIDSPPLNATLQSHAFPGFPHPLQLFPNNMAASQTAAFMAAAGNPLHLHATFQHGALFPWHSPVSPPIAATAVQSRRNNNNQVSSSTISVAKKNQANARRRKKESVEMTPVVVEPLSPPTSGSPPSNEASSGKSSGEKDNAGRDKVFTCGVCLRSFGYKHVLQNHERTHTGEKPFECLECHKRFTRDHHLKTHMRLHTGEKPYHCTHCDRQFVQVANLRRHLRVHTGERPYSCELCASRFSDSNQLKAHMLIHKGEKPFSCTACQGRFRRRHHMIHHKCPARNGVGGVHHKKELDDDMEEEVDMIGEEEDDLILSHNNNAVEKKIRSRKARDIRRVIRMPHTTASPMILSKPLVHAELPEQTEPEDLSMSTGTGHMYSNNLHRSLHSHSSGDSHTSRSPSSEGMEDLEDEEDLPPRTDQLFLQHRHPKFRRHMQQNGAAPVS